MAAMVAATATDPKDPVLIGLRSKRTAMDLMIEVVWGEDRCGSRIEDQLRASTP
jgi:hypothetical protein